MVTQIDVHYRITVDQNQRTVGDVTEIIGAVITHGQRMILVAVGSGDTVEIPGDVIFPHGMVTRATIEAHSHREATP